MTADNEGCRCRQCDRRYRVDIMVPDELWLKMGLPLSAGMLCGMCIMRRIEGLGEFDAYRLTSLVWSAEGGAE